MTIRRRLALWLCRQAGLTEVAVQRYELDEMRTAVTSVTDTTVKMGGLMKTMARQTNSNTLMLKRWLEASPNLQAVERSAQRNGKSRIILPPSGDLRIVPDLDLKPGQIPSRL